MKKKFAIILALFLIAVVCSAGCIDPETPVNPVDPVVPVDPVDPVAPVDPVVPEEPEEPVDPVVPAEGDFTVTFMMNSAVDSGVYLTVYVDEGEAVAEPAVPEKPKAQYIFVQWTTDKENKHAYDFTSPVTANLVLYADWDVKGTSSGSGHSHSYTATVTTEATCGANGVKTYTCSCGASYTEVILATGSHSYGPWVDGKQTCSVCGYVVTCEHPATALSGTNIVCTVCNTDLGTVAAQVGTDYYAKFESAMSEAETNDVIILHAATDGKVIKKVVIDTNDNETSLKYDADALTVDDIKIKQSTASKLDTVMFGDEEVVFERNADNTGYANDDEGNLIVAYTKKDTTYTVYTDSGLQMALDAANENAGEYVVNLAVDITDDVTVTQKANVKVTIDGDSDGDGEYHMFTGIMTVFGNGGPDTAALTIKNIDFVAKIGADSCILSPDRSVNNKYSYSSNVKVEKCTFTDSDGTVNCAAVRHNDGGDKNWEIIDCVVDNTMHSLIQTNNVGANPGLTIQGCKVYSKNGINLNQCEKVTISGCTIDVKGYAVRFGASEGDIDNAQESFSITDSTLKSACDDGDAVIMFRKTAQDATLKLDNTVLTGATKISGDTADTMIIIDGYSVWNGVVPVDMPKTLVVDGATQIVHVKSAAAFAYLSTLSDKWVELYTDGEGRTYTNYANGAGANYYYSGDWTVILEADIDLNNHNIEPVVIIFGESTGASTFNGDNHIIRNIKTTTGLFANNNWASYANLTLENVEATNGALTGSANTNIDNVIVKNAIISGVEYVGGLVGYIYGDVTNCKVIESSITASGKEAGGLIGYIASSSGNGKVTDNEVHEVNVYADNRAAGLVAQANNGVKVYNNIVDTATVGATDTSQYQPKAVISNALVPENVYDNTVINCNVS